MPQNIPRFIAFFDECGDHSMEKIDPLFPLFVLSTVVFEREVYLQEVVPAIANLKLKFWNHEGVNLHSRDIRMTQEDFTLLQNPLTRQLFFESLNSMMSKLNFTLFTSVIDKIEHKNLHGTKAVNPYDLSMKYTFEKITQFLKYHKEAALPVIAESRGKREDLELRSSFTQLMAQNKLNYSIEFRRKRDNIVGIQIADLCAYPTARKTLNPTKTNLAFEIISAKKYSEKTSED